MEEMIKSNATYTELYSDFVCETVNVRARRAFNRWIEKGGDASILTREYILSKDIQDVPLKPFCELWDVTIDDACEAIGIK